MKCVEGIVNWQKFFIVVICRKTDEIEEQLYNYGLKRKKIIFF